MHVETVNASDQMDGTWLVSLTFRERLAKLVLRLGSASALTAWLFYSQFQNDAPAPYMLWGFAIFSLGAFFGVRAFGIRERRVFATTEIHYTPMQRWKRAWRYLATGVVMLAVIWWVQAAHDQFFMYWWYAWPALFPITVGVGLYLLRSERVLSASGQFARDQISAENAKAADHRKAIVGELLESSPARYLAAAALVYFAFWLATESPSKNAGWLSVAAAIAALVLARELSAWLLGIATLCAVGWLLFAGLAALPLSAAIIIGALIIASSGKRG
jgi:hypothetical protein